MELLFYNLLLDKDCVGCMCKLCRLEMFVIIVMCGL